MSFNFNDLTIKAQEAVQEATEIAAASQNQAIDTAHLLKGMLIVDENVVGFLLKKLSVNVVRLNEVIDAVIAKYPKVSGGNPYLSNEANTALQKAGTYSKDLKDEYISVEHLLLGVLAVNDDTSRILKDSGVNEKELKQAIIQLRGGTRVTDQNAEAKYNALEKYAKNLNEMARSGKLDPVIGRDEDQACDSYSIPENQKQSNSYRRTRRRQNGYCRRHCIQDYKWGCSGKP